MDLEPAVGSLLDPANLGRGVVYVWNGNHKHGSMHEIVKITGTNVHLDTFVKRPVSLRVVVDDPGHATGMLNGFTVECATKEWVASREHREALVRKIGSAIWSRLPEDKLERIFAILEEE